MSAESIYKALRTEGMSHAGACGMMGNMKAESNMQANIAQRGMTGLGDAEYTALFDRSPESCIHDGVGYGLCQWTYWTRKQALRQFARNWGVTAGAEDMQVCFAVYELKNDFPELWDYLCRTTNTAEAAERICREFERPAVNNISVRAGYAGEFDRQFAITNAADKLPCDMSVLMMQCIFKANGYETELDGRKTQSFFEIYNEFGRDMKSC